MQEGRHRWSTQIILGWEWGKRRRTRFGKDEKAVVKLKPICGATLTENVELQNPNSAIIVSKTNMKRPKCAHGQTASVGLPGLAILKVRLEQAGHKRKLPKSAAPPCSSPNLQGHWTGSCTLDPLGVREDGLGAGWNPGTSQELLSMPMWLSSGPHSVSKEATAGWRLEQ